MSEQNNAGDTLRDFDKPQIPSGLNVLSIFSFIGCGLQLLGVIYTFMTAQKNFEEKDKVMEKMNSAQMPGWAKSIMPDTAHYEEMITKTYENRIPLIILGLVAVSLCLYGVIQMRKLKKQGFMFYVIGELIPFLSMGLFIGTFTYAGISFYVGCGIALLFILLYANQRKHFTS